MAVYIDSDGMSYRYNRANITAETLIDWIERKQYQSSPLKYATPPVISVPKLYWAYAKKDARKWYQTNVQPKIDPYL